MALSAFLFSMLGLLLTRKSVRISREALQETKSHNKRGIESALENKRLELLRAISTEHSMIQEALKNIGVLKAEYDAAPQNVKDALSEQASIFTGYLPLLQQYQLDVEARHAGATSWNIENGLTELITLLSEQDVAMKNTEYSISYNTDYVKEFSESFNQAQLFELAVQSNSRT